MSVPKLRDVPRRHCRYCDVRRHRLCRRHQHAVGAALQQVLDSVQGPVAKIIAVLIIIVTGLTLAFGETAGGFRRLIQIVFGISHRLRGVELLPVVLLLRRRSAGVMSAHIEGFEVPLHRALTEPILLGRRAARHRHRQRHDRRGLGPGPAAVDCRAACSGSIGHSLAVFAAKRDPDFAQVLTRHLRQKAMARMLNLAEYRRRADRLADHLPWAALVAPGVVLNKDGSFQRSFRFRGPDLESATEAELVAACARLNNVLAPVRLRLGAVLRGRALRGAGLSRIPTFPIRRPGWWMRNAGRLSRGWTALR